MLIKRLGHQPLSLLGNSDTFRKQSLVGKALGLWSPPSLSSSATHPTADCFTLPQPGTRLGLEPLEL